ncbi:MAG: pyruvate formate lyase family protein, partial [Bacillota bacterium]
MSMPSLDERLRHLIREKHKNTLEKQKAVGYMDFDDTALILPPEPLRKVVSIISGSGMPIKDVIFNDFSPEPNHADGGYYGPVGVASNFRNFLLHHPPHIDPMSALAGAYMVCFYACRKGNNPDLDYSCLHEMQEKYKVVSGIFAPEHFCQDLQIGLDLGWDGLKAKVEKYRKLHGADKQPFYDGLSMMIEGFQGWITHNAEHALRLSETEPDPEIAAHLKNLHDLNMRVAHKKPETFLEACQFILWYQMGGRSYNSSGSLGRLDVLLLPYYLRDTAAGILTDEEAVFILACQLIRDTAYIQLGGYDAQGNDTTNPVSFLILEAARRLKLPSNLGVCVGKGISRELLRRSVEMQFADKCGNPRFVGTDALVEGMAKNEGVTIEDARMRTNSGCHWLAIPGREYSLMDCVKINFAAVFEIALKDAVEQYGEPGIEQIFGVYEKHLCVAVETLAAGFTFNYDNQIHNYPELHLDLMSYGPVELGLDASNGGVEKYLWCIDGAALAVVADSFAAIEQRILSEKRYTCAELMHFLETDWAGTDGERARQYMCNVDHYGKGGTRADEFAVRLSQMFTRAVKARRTPKYGHTMVPGLFSWACTLDFGAQVGATPNGRKAGRPISHGANPNPGFRRDGAATAMSAAIASVQSGFGNTAPMQLEMEPSITADEGGVEAVMALIEDHFQNGGTLINLNVIDADTLRKAHEDPSLYPELVVRVTGFSAYFKSLSPEFRQLVVDRILDRS